MHPLVYHIVSGQAFFTGVAFVTLAVLASTSVRPSLRRSAFVTFALGVIAIVVSSTPLSYAIYALAAAVTLAWPAARFVPSWRRWAPPAVVAAWFLAALCELPYHVTPRLHPAPSRALTIIGDSVTAGIDADERSVRWPELLAKEHRLQIQDVSHMGETAASALKRVRGVEIASPVVFIEIGGNDVLGSTSPADFARDLDALLTHLRSDPDRQLLMFELPLPPLYHEYGRLQRTLARRHRVALVPKRVFLSILAESSSTLDSIHLSQEGHARMADQVWRLVQAAYPEET